MHSRMTGVLTMTSTAAARPLPSARGSSRCEITALSTLASCTRTCACWCGGNCAMIRVIVSTASSVCSAENTRWPVSDATSAVSMVSRSRSSPTRMTSGILPERAAHGVRERARVDRDLALADDRAVVAVEELDRVLDGHDVGRAGGVHVVHQRGERGALAAPGRAGDEHEATLLLGDRLQHGREAELVERLDRNRDDAKHHADRAALLEHVAAEPAEARNAVGEIDVLRVLELLPLTGRHDGRRDGHRVVVIEPSIGGRGHEVAADPHHRIAADLQVQVRGAVLDGDLEQIVHMHVG